MPGNMATDIGEGIHNVHAGAVTVAEDALVCDNLPSGSQCAGDGVFDGDCPNPITGSCPV